MSSLWILVLRTAAMSLLVFNIEANVDLIHHASIDTSSTLTQTELGLKRYSSEINLSTYGQIDIVLMFMCASSLN